MDCGYHKFIITKISVKCLLTISVMLFVLMTQGQPVIDKKSISYYPKSFVGIGHGVNCYTGIVGLGLEFPVDDHFSIFFAGGLGSWGYKAGGGMGIYLMKPNNGPSFSFGYAYASGIKNYMIEIETHMGELEVVTMNLHPVGNIQLMFHYNIPVGRSGKIAIGSGYSVKLIKENFFEIKSQHKLSDNGKEMMKILQPGGLIMSFMYCFGIR